MSATSSNRDITGMSFWQIVARDKWHYILSALALLALTILWLVKGIYVAGGFGVYSGLITFRLLGTALGIRERDHPSALSKTISPLVALAVIVLFAVAMSFIFWR